MISSIRNFDIFSIVQILSIVQNLLHDIIGFADIDIYNENIEAELDPCCIAVHSNMRDTGFIWK